jgi:tubulin-specific chaperone B
MRNMRNDKVSTRSTVCVLSAPDALADSVMAYKQAHKLGRFAPKATEQHEQTHVAHVDIPVGSRCEVESAEEGLHKRGTVRFVGPTSFAKAGVWVGIEYDEPFGKNDGRYALGIKRFGVFPESEFWKRTRRALFPVQA